MVMCKVGLYCIVLCISILGCKQEKSYVETEHQNGHIVTSFDLPNQFFPQEMLKLSELGEHFRVVALETTEKGLVDEGAKYFIGDSCIIVVQKENILLFDREGHFQRVISNAGRGPKEFLSINDFVIDEKSNLIFILEDGIGGKVKSFHLRDSAYFESIEIAEQGIYHRNLAYLGGEKLLLIPFSWRAKYLAYTQSFSGQVLDSIPWHFSEQGRRYGVTYMYTCGDRFRYLSSQTDTVFNITSCKVEPVWIFRDIQDKSYDVLGETEKYLFFVQNIIVERKILEHGEICTMDTRKFCFDKEKKILRCIEDITDDFFSQAKCVKSVTFQNGRKLLVVYQTMALCEHLKAIKEDDPNFLKWKEWRESISEQDNPVLLIGDTK